MLTQTTNSSVAMSIASRVMSLLAIYNTGREYTDSFGLVLARRANRIGGSIAT